MAKVTISMSSEAAEQVERLLELMRLASINPIGEAITMDRLKRAGFIRELLGEAHVAIQEGLTASHLVH